MSRVVLNLSGLCLVVSVFVGACAPRSASHSGGVRPATSGPAPAWDGQANQSLRIPGGEQCLWWLSKLSISHRRLAPTAGMQTPVEVTGPIAGVSYVTAGKQSVLADCRLALALDWIGPQLRALGITNVRHSGAYVYRTTKSGRPSLHAKGLALDVHGVSFSGMRSEVEKDFQRGVRDGCAGGAPRLNQLECRLRRMGLFQELITPDHNADHHDHLHLGIAPLQ